MDLSIHSVKEIKLSDVRFYKDNSGDFYVRDIFITTETGEKITIIAFSSDGYALVPGDKENEKLLQAA